MLLVIGMSVLRWIIGGVSGAVGQWQFAAPLAIAGFGLGTAISALFQTILSGVPPRDAGSGSGALQSIQQIGGALGVALVGEIFFASLAKSFAAGAAPHAAFVGAAKNAMIYEIAAFALMAAMVPLLKPAAPGSRSAPAPVAAEG
jgi:hypothetical protein